MRQLPVYDRSPLHFKPLVIHVRRDAGTWADFNSPGTRYLAIDRASDHQVRDSHLAINASLVADHQFAGLVGLPANAAVHASLHDQLSAKNDLTVDMRARANKAALFDLRLLILANHITLHQGAARLVQTLGAESLARQRVAESTPDFRLDMLTVAQKMSAKMPGWIPVSLTT